MNDNYMQSMNIECPQCGTALKPYQKFCPVCGNSVAQMPNSNNNSATSAPKNIKRCRQCGAVISPDRDLCVNCSMTARSSMLSSPAITPPSSPFVKIAEPPAANPVYSEIDQYNATVGKGKGMGAALSSNKKTIYIAAAVAGVIGIIIAAVAINSYLTKQAEEKLRKQQQQDYETYMDTAGDFYYLVLSDCTLMEDIGNDVYSYWWDAIWKDKYGGSIDLAVAYALSNNQSDIDTIESDYIKIQGYYNELSHVPDGIHYSEMQEVKEAAEELFDMYEEFYDVVLSPSGSLTDYKSEFQRIDTEGADLIDEFSFMAD